MVKQPERIDVRDVEFFRWERDPALRMTVDEYEWMLSHDGNAHLWSLLVQLAKVAVNNNRLRVWYEQRHTTVTYPPEMDFKTFVREHMERRKDIRFDSIFASVYVCRICTEKLWSGLTTNRLMQDSAYKTLCSHATTHVTEAMIKEGMATTSRFRG